jgi:hypothetical protein
MLAFTANPDFFVFFISLLPFLEFGRHGDIAYRAAVLQVTNVAVVRFLT